MSRLRKLYPGVITTCVTGLLCLVTPPGLAEPIQSLPDSTGFETPAVRFDSLTHRVTLTLPVQDSRGHYIPAARPDSFVVYENGARQKEVSVQVQRSPVSLGVLLEYGGRYPSLNEAISTAVSAAARSLVNDLTQEDSIAVWTYGDRLAQLSPFQQGRENLQHALQTLVRPPLSESNLYDALASALTQMRTVGGRRALLLISSGVDTFSQARYEDLLDRLRDSAVPIYVIDLSGLLQRDVAVSVASAPYSRLDWKHAGSRLAEIARLSGGHRYAPASTFELAALYDDLMESLRARNTLSYISPTKPSAVGSRTVRVELLDSKSGIPLKMADANGRPLRANLVIAGTYIPSSDTETLGKATS